MLPLPVRSRSLDEAPTPPAVAVLEREAELAALDRLLARARAGRGGLVLIEGAPGIGKTRLLDAARAMAADAGMQSLRATGTDLEREFSFGIVLQLLEARLRAADPDDRASLLSGAASLAAPLLEGGLDVWRGDAAAAMPLLHGLYWLTSNLAERGPLAICVDDAQWADRSSLGFLVYLLQRLDELPVALAVAVRRGEPEAPEDLLAQLAGHPATVLARPRPLSPAAAQRLLRNVAPDAEAAFCGACAEVTGGNPLLLLTLLDGLTSEGVAPTAAALSRLERAAPEKVLRAVVTRLRRLPPPAQALASAVATLGPDASLRQAAALARLDLDMAAVMADVLAAAGVLTSGEPVAFVHPLVRSAVYADIPAAQRALAHGRAARMLTDAGAEPEQAAAHLLAASPSGEAWAVAVLRGAAGRALADGAPASAVRYLRRAVEEQPARPERAEILVELARAEALAGDPAAAAHLDAALALTDDAQPQGRVLLELGRALYASGRLPDAAAAFERGAEAVHGVDSELEAELRAGWAAVARLIPALRPRAQALVTEVLERGDGASSHGERVLLAHAAEHLVFAGEDRDRAVALVRAALGDGALLAEETSDGMSWFLAVANLAWCDEFAEYERELDAGLQDARRRGSVWGFAKVSYLRSYATYHTGRLAESVADAQQALDAARYGWEQFLPAVHMWLAWTLMECGQLEDAERVLAGVEDSRRWAGTSMHALVLHGRSRLALMRDRPREALDDLLAAGRIATEALIANPAIIVPWRSSAALAAARLGDRRQALDLVEEELALARRFGARRPIGMALRVAGVVEGGEAGIRRLEEAVDVLARSPAALEHARALISLGAALRRANRRAAAREPLRRGLDMAHRFGAAVMAAQAREELLATGARPRRLVLTGVDSLTPSERRTAQMAARGMSNREIAQALFVTLKTVETHLAAVYRKLDLHSRAGLAEVLARAPEAPQP